MKITGEEQSGWVTFERIDYPHLIQGFSDQLRWPRPIFFFWLLHYVHLSRPFLFVGFGFGYCRLESRAQERWGWYSEKVADPRVIGKTKSAIRYDKSFRNISFCLGSLLHYM